MLVRDASSEWQLTGKFCDGWFWPLCIAIHNGHYAEFLIMNSCRPCVTIFPYISGSVQCRGASHNSNYQNAATKPARPGKRVAAPPVS
jgi:hypothetical protein